MKVTPHCWLCDKSLFFVILNAQGDLLLDLQFSEFVDLIRFTMGNQRSVFTVRSTSEIRKGVRLCEACWCMIHQVPNCSKTAKIMIRLALQQKVYVRLIYLRAFTLRTISKRCFESAIHSRNFCCESICIERVNHPCRCTERRLQAFELRRKFAGVQFHRSENLLQNHFHMVLWRVCRHCDPQKGSCYVTSSRLQNIEWFTVLSAQKLSFLFLFSVRITQWFMTWFPRIIRILE